MLIFSVVKELAGGGVKQLPSLPLGGCTAEGTNSTHRDLRKITVAAGTVAGGPEAVELLGPHQVDLRATGRSRLRQRTENVDPKGRFEPQKMAERALILAVCAGRPSMNHIQEAHTFKGQKATVG